jgi:hypothetical protein
MQRAFCADFDESMLALGWTTTQLDNSGNEARLYKDLGVQPTTIVFAFDLRIEHLDVDCHVAKITMSTNSRVVLGAASPAVVYEEGPLADGGSYQTPYPLAGSASLAPAWNHVVMTLSFAAPPSVSVVLNGTTVLTRALSALYQNGLANVSVGAHESGSGLCQMRYDKVTVDLPP